MKPEDVDEVLPPHAMMTLIEGERKAARERLQEERDPLTAARVALAVYQGSDASTANLKDDPACREGCAWCCRGVRVDVNPPEAIAIAEYFKHVCAPEDYSAIRTYIAEAAERSRKLSIDDRHAQQIPCVFLDQETNVCTIYHIRPMRCRGHCSYDANACEQACTDTDPSLTVPVSFVRQSLAGAFTTGQNLGIRDANCDANGYELTNAVHVAISEPNAGERWARGETLFEAARIPSDDADRASSLEQVLDTLSNGPTVFPRPPRPALSRNQKKAQRRKAKGK
jgi:Fe-S-cluster containining protein